ncbi:MAG: hypothetical protein ACOY0T_07400 [Myxococcota bacterium]
MIASRPPPRIRTRIAASLVLLASYLGCDPDLDKLSSEYGRGGASSGGTATGGASEPNGGTTGGKLAGGAPGLGGASVGNGGSAMSGLGGSIAPMGGSGGAGGDTPAGGEGGGGGVSNAGAGGEGGAPCEPGFSSCPGSPACSTDLKRGNPAANSAADCGVCGVTCSVGNATRSDCLNGTCTPMCKQDFADCNGATVNDGCEANLTSPATCGACGHACSNIGTTSRSCTAGKCVPTCAPKYANCNADTTLATDDGCEVYLDSLSKCATDCSNGVACATNQVCNAGVCGAPQGIVVFSVPLTAAAQIQRYADKFTPAVNLTNSIITVRMYAPGATNGVVNIYLSDADFSGSNGQLVELVTLNKGWTDVAVPVGGISGEFNPIQVTQVNLEVGAGNAGPWTNPTLVYVDSVRTSNALVNDTFDASIGNMVRSQSVSITGSTLSWQTAMP